jgi:Ni,Fe-hydrogenase maturation factor
MLTVMGKSEGPPPGLLQFGTSIILDTGSLTPAVMPNSTASAKFNRNANATKNAIFLTFTTQESIPFGFNILSLVNGMRMKVLCFGNKNFKGDELALKVGKKLKGKIKNVEFVQAGMDELELLSNEENEIIAIDVVKGIKAVQFVLPEELVLPKTVTAHDIDAAFYIKLLAKTGAKIRIIGIPEKMSEQKAVDGALKLMKKLTSGKKPD